MRDKRRRRKCRACGCRFYPRKNIKDQKYCSDERCQRIRKYAWLLSKLSGDMDYVINKKKSQRKWKEGNSDYWIHYVKKILDSKKLNKEGKGQNQQKRKISRVKSKKPILRISIEKDTLANLNKTEDVIDCECKLILIS